MVTQLYARAGRTGGRLFDRRQQRSGEHYLRRVDGRCLRSAGRRVRRGLGGDRDRGTDQREHGRRVRGSPGQTPRGGVGIGANALACLLLPVLSFGVEGALVGLFLFFITFEFGVVSLIPLMTELAPGARVTLLAGNVAAFSGGRMLGALIGPPLFHVGLLANSLTAAAFNGIALVVLLVFLKHD